MDVNETIPVSVSPYVGARASRCQGVVRDVHREGLTLELPRQIARKTLLHVSAEGLDEPGFFPTLVFVQASEQLAAGNWALACQFIKGLCLDELDEMLREAAVV